MRSQSSASVGVLAFVVSLTLVVDVRAQETKPDFVVTVHGKRGSSFEQTSPLPRSTTTREEVRAAAPQSLADALRRRPATSVQQTTPGQGTIYVRGLSGRALVHSVDGVRLNAAIFRDGNNPYLGLVDPYALERIDVVPGAASVFYGSDALGGAVLMFTELPGYHLDQPTTTFGGYQGLTSNPVNTTSRLSLSYSAAAWAAHAGITAVQSGAVRPGEGERSPIPASYRGLTRAAGDPYRPATSALQRGTEFSFYSADTALRRRFGAGTEVVARAQIGVRPELERYDQITPRFKNTVPDRAEASLSPMYRAMGSLTLERRSLTGPFDRLQARLSWQRLFERSLRRDFAESCLDGGGADPCVGTLRLDPEPLRTTERNRSDALGLTLAVESKSPGGVWRLRSGAELIHDIVSSEASEQDLLTGVETPQPERFPNGSTQTQAALMAAVDLRALPPLVLSLGGRAAVFALHVPERAVTGGVPSPAFDKTLLDAAASAGARVTLAPRFDAFANAGRGLRAPSVHDFSTLGPRARGRFQVPNTAIRPEHSLSLDAGFALDRRRARAQVALFYLLYDDAVVLAPTTSQGSELTVDGDRYYHATNAASTEVWGIESHADVAVAQRAALFGRWLAMLGVQRNSPDAGGPLETPADRIPPHQGELGIRLEPDAELRIEAFASGRLAQERLNDPINLGDNRIPEGGTPGYVTFHLHGAWQAERALLLRLLLDNLTNELVLEHGSGFYRAGFSATLSLEARIE